MIEADKIEAISAADVRSSDDDKVGSVGQVFLDPLTGRPEWAVVKTGIFGTKGAFVPLRNASWDGRVVRLAYDKDRVRNAPHVEPDERGLDPDQQVQLYTYYGFTEATQPSADTTSATASGSSPASASASSPASTPGSDAVDPTPGPSTATPHDSPRALSDPASAEAAPESPAVAAAPVPLSATAAAAAAASDTTSAEDADPADPVEVGSADDATMTRMEERLQVSVEPTATERVRLRKHVVTTQETVTVTIRREELRIERVPITADEARSLGSGPGIGESETDIVLYEERPVVTTVARPVERIRLTREVVAEQQDVTGDVRKERIEVEGGGIG